MDKKLTLGSLFDGSGGFHGERSGLFFQVIRIIKKMLAATNNEYEVYHTGKRARYIQFSGRRRFSRGARSAGCIVHDMAHIILMMFVRYMFHIIVDYFQT